ncbi:hypothetical protein B484DRAFT_208637 [Ochromonadaceae sp. CCMP2298]|nr:hypothetical protein B484DRAFT_208637 [Ochromonadaceae sp. CCMP2298]
MEYTAYLFEALPLRTAMADHAQGQPLLSTLCGLEVAAAALDPLHWRRSRAVLKAFEQGADLMTHSFEGLRAGTEYSVVLAAVCSGECLRQLSKVTALPPRVTTSCSDSTSSCRAQSLVFAQVAVTTAASPDEVGSDDEGGSYVPFIITGARLALALMLLVLLAAAAYYVKSNTQSVWAEGSYWVRTWTGSSNGAQPLPTDSDHGEGGQYDSDHGGAFSSHGSSFGSAHGFFDASSPEGRKGRGGGGGGEVEMESYSYTPPSMPSGADETIDFRSKADKSAGEKALQMGEKISGAAATALSRAGSVINTIVNVHNVRPPPPLPADRETANPLLPAPRVSRSGGENQDGAELHL